MKVTAASTQLTQRYTIKHRFLQASAGPFRRAVAWEKVVDSSSTDLMAMGA